MTASIAFPRLRCSPRLARRRAARLTALLPLLTVLVLAGCRQAKPAAEYGTVEMRIGSRTFHLEVAATDPARQYGLMNRESMAADHGMIFVFANEQPREFWMKNTLIPLDIVYLDASGAVVSIKHGTPKQESPTVASDGAMKYAIELNEGAAARAGVKVGDKLLVPLQARDSADGG